MTDAQWHRHDNRDAFVTAVAGQVAEVIEHSVAARDRCLLAAPGGGTPRPIFQALARAPLPWDKVTLVPTDERLVAEGTALRNDRLLRESFALTGPNIRSLVPASLEVAAAGLAAGVVLQELPWPPDLVWLGMGEDGHTASLFAGPDLEAALNAPDGQRAIGVRPEPLPPEAPVSRVSLTKAAILSARSLMVTITGERKQALLEQALREGDNSRLPIGRVLAGAARPVSIHWCRA